MKDWYDYCNHSKLPDNIPLNPDIAYKNKGWGGWKDFLSTGKRINEDWLPYDEAKIFVHKLKLSSSYQWQDYCHGLLPDKPNKPYDIPISVETIYRNKGWIGWYDFLGKVKTVNYSHYY